MRFEVPCPSPLPAFGLGPVVRPGQSMFDLQLGADLLQPIVIVPRLDIPQRPRMNLVDGNVQVPVVGVLVHRRDALMLGEADRRADRVLDILNLLPASVSHHPGS